jgi:hypothetical protein
MNSRYTLRQRFLRFLGAYVETAAIWLMDKAEPPEQSDWEKVMGPVLQKWSDQMLDPLEPIRFPTVNEIEARVHKQMYDPLTDPTYTGATLDMSPENLIPGYKKVGIVGSQMLAKDDLSSPPTA